MLRIDGYVSMKETSPLLLVQAACERAAPLSTGDTDRRRRLATRDVWRGTHDRVIGWESRDDSWE